MQTMNVIAKISCHW